MQRTSRRASARASHRGFHGVLMLGARVHGAADALDGRDLVQAAGRDRGLAAASAAPGADLGELRRRVRGRARSRRFFVNSVFIVAGRRPSSVAVTSMIAGAVFAKYRFPGRGVLFMLILATAIVPFESYMIPLYLQLMRSTGSTPIRASSCPTLFMSFGIFLMRQHVASAIPTSYWKRHESTAPRNGGSSAA